MLKNNKSKLASLVAVATATLAALVSVSAQAQTTTGTSTSASTSSSTGSGSSSSSKDPNCHGRIFNPLSQMDWNLLFPYTIEGASLGSGSFNPPWMYEPVPCICPGPFDIPSIGISMTYWSPNYISEIQRDPGCLSTLGGSQVLGTKYTSLMGEHEDGQDGKQNGTTTRMQGHWYEYPVSNFISWLKKATCKSTAGFALSYMTEFDPTWQDDSWGAMYTPENVLFSNPVAQVACTVDAVSSQVGLAADPLFWCAGAWGAMYPMTGNSQPGNGPYLVDGQVQAKFMARLHRVGMLWQTIGPSATCFYHPNPVMAKSQYRLDQIAPIARFGGLPPPVIGSLGEQLTPPVANTPGLESTDYMIFQGEQCCARAY